MKSWAALLYLLVFSFSLLAQVSDEEDMGNYLIYDCKEKHWACVPESAFKDCQKKREDELAARPLSLSCAAFEPYPTVKSCTQRILFLTSQNYGTRFCIGNDWKQKEMIFGPTQ